MEKDKLKTVNEIINQIGNDTYKAVCHHYEKLEYLLKQEKGICFGNGHHAAQKLCLIAKAIVIERIKRKSFGANELGDKLFTDLISQLESGE